jgi:hypothetical protein
VRQVFLQDTQFFPCQYHSTMALHTHLSSRGRTIGSLVATVQTHSLTPSTWTKIMFWYENKIVVDMTSAALTVTNHSSRHSLAILNTSAHWVLFCTAPEVLMLDLFGSVHVLFKLKAICVNNKMFQLHYKTTVAMLTAFSLIVTSKQYCGDPFLCLVKADLTKSAVYSYCWIYPSLMLAIYFKGKFKKRRNTKPYGTQQDFLHTVRTHYM